MSEEFPAAADCSAAQEITGHRSGAAGSRLDMTDRRAAGSSFMPTSTITRTRGGHIPYPSKASFKGSLDKLESSIDDARDVQPCPADRREINLRVVGVDGCPGGWIAMCWDVEHRSITPGVHESLTGLIEHYADAGAIGIDMPIGLSDTGTRACDVEARRVLGRGRAASVFPPPVRDILHASTYEEAVALSREMIGRGVSRQSFAIFGKLLEAMHAVTPELQDRVFEVHPEVSFWALAGAPMSHRKGGPDGYNERKSLLEEATGVDLPSRDVAFKVARPAKPDDILDAVVAAWTARRVVGGVAQRLPPATELDSAGLRMEIVY